MRYEYLGSIGRCTIHTKYHTSVVVHLFSPRIYVRLFMNLGVQP